LFSIFLAGNNYRQLPWGALDDVVMGGVSESTYQIDPSGGENGGPTGVFKGMCQILEMHVTSLLREFIICVLLPKIIQICV